MYVNEYINSWIDYILPPRCTSHPPPLPTLKVSIAPKLIAQALRVLNLEARGARADFGVQLRNQRLHALARAHNQLYTFVSFGPGFGEPADC